MMQRRLLTCEDKGQAQLLWHIEFPEDSECFVRWFFDKRFLPAWSAGTFCGDTLISVIHGTPMMLRGQAKSFPALMTSGVATLPGYEGRGIMHDTMLFLREKAAKQGIDALFNHPQRKGAYAHLGFRPCTDTLYYKGDGGELLPRGYTWASFDLEAAFTLYKQVMSIYRGSRVRTKSDFVLLLEDIACDGGIARLLLKNGSPEGYCLFGINETGLYAQEVLCLDKEVYAPLLRALPGKHITAKLPPDIPLPGERLPQNVLLASERLWAALAYIPGQCYCLEEY